MTYIISTDTAQGAINSNKLHDEIDSSGHVTNFKGITACDDILTIHGTVSNQAGLDSIVNNHEAEGLVDLKVKRCLEIDLKTSELINSGFSFDDGGGAEFFSLSNSAQLNWLAIYTLESLLTWPKAVSKKDDKKYQLQQADKTAFVGAALGTIVAHYESGLNLKDSINNSTTKAEIDAIIDNR